MTHASQSGGFFSATSARALAITMLVFGVFASFVGGFGAFGSFVSAAFASGCDVMAQQAMGVGAALLGAVGILHVVGPWSFLRAPAQARGWMVALCGFNCLVNLGLAVALVIGEQALLSTGWWLLLALNVVGVVLFARTRITLPAADALQPETRMS